MSVARLVAVAEGVVVVFEAHLGGDDVGCVEHHRAVMGVSARHRRLHLCGVVHAKALRRAIRDMANLERRRIELHVMVIAGGAEPKPVIETLLEHPQGANGGTVVGTTLKRSSSHGGSRGPACARYGWW